MTTTQASQDIHPGVRASAEAAEHIVPFKMAHLVFRCRRRAETVGWYMKLFQARLVFEDDVLTFITYDDEHHRLAFFNMPDIPEKNAEASGVHHVAYSFRTLAELLKTYTRLKAVGILPYWCINHGPTTSLYFRDPEGNDIEFQVDNNDHAGDYFHSDDFKKNPIGVEFDPDELVSMLQSGISEADLCKVGTAATGKSTIL